MKNPLSSLYEQILISEAQNKQDLTNPSQSEVGSLKQNQDAFGSKPQVVSGPEKASIAKGPSYKISTSSETATQYSKEGKFKGSAPAKPKSSDEPEETETPESAFPEGDDEEKSKEDSKKEKNSESSEEKYTKKNKYIRQHENFTMSAFETLFKKTLIEELENEDEATLASAPEGDLSDDVMSDDEPLEDESSEEESEESEADLVSDLRELQSKLDSILSKLEGLEEEEEDSDEENSDEEYSDEDFDTEFSTEEEPSVTKESVDKPKALSDSKGKQLTSKKNKVGKLAPKGGKAYVGKFKNNPNPKNLSTKVSKSAEVKSTVKKGDFLK